MRYYINRDYNLYEGKYMLGFYEDDDLETCRYVFTSVSEMRDKLRLGADSPDSLISRALERGRVRVRGEWLRVRLVPMFEEDIEKGVTLRQFRDSWVDWFGYKELYITADGVTHREFDKDNQLWLVRLGYEKGYDAYGDFIVTDCKVTERIHIWLRKP